jgi:hypothetical protein
LAVLELAWREPKRFQSASEHLQATVGGLPLSMCAGKVLRLMNAVIICTSHCRYCVHACVSHACAPCIQVPCRHHVLKGAGG